MTGTKGVVPERELSLSDSLFGSVRGESMVSVGFNDIFSFWRVMAGVSGRTGVGFSISRGVVVLEVRSSEWNMYGECEEMWVKGGRIWEFYSEEGQLKSQ